MFEICLNFNFFYSTLTSFYKKKRKKSTEIILFTYKIQHLLITMPRLGNRLIKPLLIKLTLLTILSTNNINNILIQAHKPLTLLQFAFT